MSKNMDFPPSTASTHNQQGDPPAEEGEAPNQGESKTSATRRNSPSNASTANTSMNTNTETSSDTERSSSGVGLQRGTIGAGRRVSGGTWAAARNSDNVSDGSRAPISPQGSLGHMQWGHRNAGGLSAHSAHNSDDFFPTDAYEEREVYSFGQNSYGELGHGHTEERRVPVHVEYCQGKNIVCIAAGNEHTVLLSDTGVVYAAGYNDSGQCGTGNSGRVPSLQAVESFRGKGVVELVSSNGCEHTSAITEDGELFTCGYNARGQLGHGNRSHQSIPRRVESLCGHRVRRVSCSYYHSIVVCDDNTLFGYGRNDYGQLGLGHNEDKLRPQAISFFDGLQIVDIACGQYHTLVSVEPDGIFAFGKNDYGQLGVSSSEPRWTPVSVTGFTKSLVESNNNSHVRKNVDSYENGAQVVRVACGYYHSLVLRKDGSIFAFGRNDYGQLGLGNNESASKPMLIDSLDGVHMINVTSGCYHSIALTDAGRVYVWGRNNHGQLGIGTTDDANSPARLDALAHKTVIKIAAGFYHTLLLTGSQEHVSQMAAEQSSLSSDLAKLLNNPARSDVTFIVQGMPIHAHRCVIMCRCDPLERMLDGPMRESQQNKIVLHDQSYDVFMSFLEYLYTDRVQALQKPHAVEFALDLLTVADQFLVESLKMLCESTIQKSINVENVASMLSVADSRGALGLRKKCFDYILRHFGKVIGTPTFSEISKPLLQEVLFAASKRGVHLR